MGHSLGRAGPGHAVRGHLRDSRAGLGSGWIRWLSDRRCKELPRKGLALPAMLSDRAAQHTGRRRRGAWGACTDFLEQVALKGRGRVAGSWPSGGVDPEAAADEGWWGKPGCAAVQKPGGTPILDRASAWLLTTGPQPARCMRRMTPQEDLLEASRALLQRNEHLLHPFLFPEGHGECILTTRPPCPQLRPVLPPPFYVDTQSYQSFGTITDERHVTGVGLFSSLQRDGSTWTDLSAR